ncbi:MAG: MOSC domain-containing protein [Gammaproteobacteria bacterium]|jgi:MOSC domain-containing protein YiiM
MNGRVVSIYVAEKSGGPLTSLTTAELTVGRGIVSDRHYFRPDMEPRRELTLIEYEEIERLNRDAGLDLSPEECRRNLVTRGIRLNGLVGKEFRLGDIRLRGMELCEPCAYLADLLHKQSRLGTLTRAEFVAKLAHRAGLRARVLEGGVLSAGELFDPAGDTA